MKKILSPNELKTKLVPQEQEQAQKIIDFIATRLENDWDGVYDLEIDYGSIILPNAIPIVLKAFQDKGWHVWINQKTSMIIVSDKNHVTRRPRKQKFSWLHPDDIDIVNNCVKTI